MAKTKVLDRQVQEEQPVGKQPDLAATKKVITQVMNALGLPPGWVVTKAMNTWDNNWRVDVYAKEPDLGIQCLVRRNRMVDSFFVKTDDDAVIQKSDPEIVKRYE